VIPGVRQPFVLVADDDRDTRELYRAAFDTSGYRTAEAETGSQAIVSAVEIVPDVLLTDYVLPDLDGLTIARRLKADVRTTGIRIVMITGYGTPELTARAADAGVERVMMKPCLPQEAMREVARILTRPMQRQRPAARSARSTNAGPPVRSRIPRVGDAEVTRVRDEFAALPGLALTAEQARLVFDLDRVAAAAILQALVVEGFLARTPHGAYWRPDRRPAPRA
jgi:CheY-like chemotaxis protein